MSGGGVLQQLMAERKQTNRNSEVIRDSSHGNSPLTKAKNLPPNYPSTRTPPRRALSEESPNFEIQSQAHPYLNSSSRSAESSAPQFSAANFSTPHPAPSRFVTVTGSVTGPGSGNLISRLRQEFLNKPGPQMQVTNTQQMNTAFTDVAGVHAGNNTSRTPAQASVLSRGNLPSPSSSKQQLYGHPKSNSAGEEFLYTDRKAKLASNKVGRRRCKNSTSIMRSKSLHYANESQTPQVVVQRRPATDFRIGKEPFPAPGTPRKWSDASTVSSSSGTSDKPGSHGSSAGDGYFQISLNEEAKKSTDLPQFTSNSGSLSDIGNTQFQQLTHLSSIVMTPSGMGGLPQPAMTQSNPHGPYYATVPTNPIGHHPNPQRHSPPPALPHQQITQTATPPRGPPPPYPQGSGINDEHHPQRPNSLPLSGQISRKKMDYSGARTGGLTSPAIATTAQIIGFNYPMSAGTPIHGTPFCTFPQEVPAPTTTANGSNNIALQGYSVTPQQPPQGQFKRSGSSNGFPQRVATSQSQIAEIHTTSTTTNIAVPFQQPRYDTPRQAQHATPQKQQSNSPIYSQQGQEFQSGAGYPVAGSSSGFSIGKSDSNASTSSAGSKIARRSKRYSKNFSNTSESSSSTGNSRPNSSADSLERILSEYESLRSQLSTTEKKLKKYQNVEKELLRVTKDYEILQASATKRENMESELRTQLEATNSRTQQENDILRERISTLAELVETLQSSNKDAQTSSGDIMTYKIIVKELKAKERILEEQLEESQDRISEQKEDISLLSSSLERMQTQVAMLKEKGLEKQRSDQYVEELLPLLDKLASTVEMRLQVENELSVIVGVAQRRSTSSNDEGISEMDPLENASPVHSQSCSTQSTSSTLARDEQLLRMHAQMLKWQHMYLQTALLRELSVSEGDSGSLYSMLNNHRHALSDPSHNKNTVLDLPVWHPTGLKSLYRRDADIKREHKHADSIKHAQSDNRERTTSGHGESSPRRRGREMTSPQKDQLPENSSLPNECSDLDKKAVSESQDSSYENVDRKTTPKEDSSVNAEVQGPAEVDSPSEGYHSQQSSGSPTPSSERSSVHFPEGDSRVTAALGPLQDTPPCSNPVQTNVATTRQGPDPSTNTGLYVVNV